MRACKSLWLFPLSVVATAVILVSALSFVPSIVGGLSPREALADDLPPEVTSAVTQATGTLHTLSVSGAAFTPNGDISFFKDRWGIQSLDEQGANFYAPVDLPQGARVVRLVAFCHDNGPGTVEVNLERIAMGVWSDSQVMAWLESIDSAEHPQKLATNTVSYATIKSDSYSYLLYARLSSNQPALRAVKIVYYY